MKNTIKITKADVGREVILRSGETDKIISWDSSPTNFPVETSGAWLRENGREYDDEQSSWDIIAFADEDSNQEPKPFKLELGKSYRRRDGTGPVRIVRYMRGTNWPFSENEYENETAHHTGQASYTAEGLNDACFIEGPRDLVAEWVEPEAAQPEPQPVSNAAMVGEAAPANDNSEKPEEGEEKASDIGKVSLRLELNTVESHSIRAIACELILMGEDAAGCLLIKREAELEKRLAKAA